MISEAKITFVSRSDSEGGAAIATSRLFSVIRRDYPNAEMLCATRLNETPKVRGLHPNRALKSWLRLANEVNAPRYVLNPSSKAAQFTRNRVPINFTIKTEIKKSSLVHLHWTSMGTLPENWLTGSSVPIVWTLHDMWPLTGGCHYSGSCRRYEAGCGNCPLLRPAKGPDLSARHLEKRIRIFAGRQLHLVAPSMWLANKARISLVFRNRPITVIPNGVDSEIFCGEPPAKARQELGFPTDRPVLLMGSESLSDKRKGTDLVWAALSAIDRKITVAVFGGGSIPRISNPNIEVLSFGFVKDAKQLARLYSAADVFCCASREDNLPNTAVEAVVSGTPVVGFNSGGLPEVVTNGVSGIITDLQSPESLLSSINIVLDSAQHRFSRGAIRELGVSRFGIQAIAQRYKKIYSNLLARS